MEHGELAKLLISKLVVANWGLALICGSALLFRAPEKVLTVFIFLLGTSADHFGINFLYWLFLLASAPLREFKVLASRLAFLDAAGVA